MARKKWKLKFWPTATEQRATSEKNAYETVWTYQRRFADGTGRVTAITVYVDEGDGRWRTYERCDFTTPAWTPLPTPDEDT